MPGAMKVLGHLVGGMYGASQDREGTGPSGGTAPKSEGQQARANGTEAFKGSIIHVWGAHYCIILIIEKFQTT